MPAMSEGVSESVIPIVVRGAAPPGRTAFALPPQIAEVARTLIEPLSDRMAADVRDRVTPFRDRHRADLDDVLNEPIRLGITSFVDVLEHGPGRRAEIEATFQEIGRQEALHGNSLENLRSIMLIAARTSWQAIHRRCRELQVPDGVLGRIGDLLFAHIDNLERQISIGHLAMQSELRQTAARWRGPLVAALLAGERAARLEELAAPTGWPLPSSVQVIAVRTPHGADGTDPSALPEVALTQVGRPISVVVTPADHASSVLARIPAAFGHEPVALSWPVAPSNTPDGVRWARRALELSELGVLPPRLVIDCADHVSTLWLHAEPLLRQLVVQRQLAPLMREPARSRKVLSETLLLYLETRGSAPALAERLGVHPQTVRYRLRRLRLMFGDRIDAPESLTMLLALRSSMALWDAGVVEA